ncbi:hypothetical protein HY625_01165 [Candidatus Uhrbacteria bacterium]|nr:hypothetical protein [Candidatus Uhrbacteria bacterium]
MSEESYHPEEERLRRFATLRKDAHAECDRETAERIATNPTLTEDEVYIGAFREMIEPQVRDAIFMFHRKGYATESSGFGGDGTIQQIDGYYAIDAETQKKIEALGAHVLRGKEAGSPGQSEHHTYILFTAPNPDCKEMKETWDAIASVLPDLGHRAPPPVSGGSEDFRKQFAPSRTDVERVALERALSFNKFRPDIEVAMRKRIAELSQD